MTEQVTQERLARDLQRILSSDTIGPKQKKMARSLLDRFQKPVLVSVMGPDPVLNETVRQGVNALSAEPAVRLLAHAALPSPEAGDFEQVDIAIWCSAAFDVAEQRLWAKAPDALKDRSVLVLVRGGASQVAPDMSAELFDEVLVVDPTDPAKALARLSDKLLQRVRAGLRADADNAAFLIESCHLPADAAVSVPNAVPSPVDVSEAAEAGAEPLSEIKALMQNHAASLAASDLEGKALATHVLASCEELLRQASEVMDQAPEGLLSNLFRADMQDAQDEIVLMGLEGGEDAAADAVTTLIQLRKELHLERVA